MDYEGPNVKYQRSYGGKYKAEAAVKASADITVGAVGFLEMIDTFDRPGKAFTADTYADSGAFANGFEDKPMSRIPRAGLYAGAGLGLARAEWRCFDAQAKGPNASAGLEASLVSGARAFAKAELASASASAGPVKATVGLGVDTGASIGLTGVEAKVLGTGFSIGKKIGASFLGNSVEVNVCVIS